MSTRPPRTPLVLLGLLTVLTVAGPFAIAYALRGGASPRWPPDRPREWWTFGLVTGGYLALMAACLGIGLASWRRTLAGTKSTPPSAAPVDESFNPD
jgi:hypothetical protein